MEGGHLEKDGVNEEKNVFMSGEGLMTFQQCSLEAFWEQVWSMLKIHSKQMESMSSYIFETLYPVFLKMVSHPEFCISYSSR